MAATMLLKPTSVRTLKMQRSALRLRWMTAGVGLALLALDAIVPSQVHAVETSVTAAITWPADSLYQVDVPLETAAGEQTRFASGSGRVRIVTMFYASCPMACPLTIDTLRQVDAAIGQRARVGFDMLLLSIDPAADTPAALAKLAQERRITDPRWTLARASESDTRKLAAVLGVQYRKLQDGNFDHSSTLILVDKNGRVLARSNQIGKPSPDFIASIRSAIGENPSTAKSR